MTSTPSPSRRHFLAGSAGLVIGLALPLRARAQAAQTDPFKPNAFIRLAPDNSVTILSTQIEFGQGPWTGLATLAADEMDAAWDLVRVEHSPSDPKIYHSMAPGVQGTGGSSSMANMHMRMRQAGATAKAMLIAAAAQQWNVPASDIKAEQSRLSHGDKSATYGEMAAAAAAIPAPKNVTLKKPDEFIYIGNENLPKIDTVAKSDGSAIYTLDIYKDNMLTALVAHPDILGAKVESFDDSQTRAIPGIVDVKKIETGVAVYANKTFAALKGRKALKVQWSQDKAETRSSQEITQACLDAAQKPGTSYHEHGNVDAAFDKAAKILDAQYTFPYLAHAPMEPLDAIFARRTDGDIDVWMGSQIQTIDHGTIAKVCGVPKEKVHLNTMLAGGSFGRRAQGDGQFAAEAAQVFMASGGERPVKIMWTREDDIQGEYYRPITVHRMRGALDENGTITAMDQIIAGQSIAKGTPFESFMIKNGVDATMTEGAREIPYSLPARRGSVHIVDSAVKVLWWRSVGHTHTGYALETFIDELLSEGGQDPVEGRLALMQKQERLSETLKRAADIADWGRTPKEGRAFGVATVESFNSYVSQIVEVSMEDARPKIHKVWCAVDCGLAINPSIIKAQMEGGIGYGLGAILYNALILGQGGRIQQNNFNNYPSLRIGDMPDVEVSIIQSDAPPTGVGEPGTPPIGPAVANAIRNLTGQPVRNLPMVPALQS